MQTNVMVRRKEFASDSPEYQKRASISLSVVRQPARTRTILVHDSAPLIVRQPGTILVRNSDIASMRLAFPPLVYIFESHTTIYTSRFFYVCIETDDKILHPLCISSVDSAGYVCFADRTPSNIEESMNMFWMSPFHADGTHFTNGLLTGKRYMERWADYTKENAERAALYCVEISHKIHTIQNWPINSHALSTLFPLDKIKTQTVFKEAFEVIGDDCGLPGLEVGV